MNILADLDGVQVNKQDRHPYLPDDQIKSHDEEKKPKTKS